MTDRQLQPFENVELGEKQDQLQVFEKAVLEHEGKGSAEDSGTAPLPENYPCRKRMLRAAYEAEKAKLQIELLKVQSRVKDSGQRIVSLFEGRDAAGKGGAIKRFMEHLNPRGARVVALEKPTTTERGQWYFQRYIQNLPTAGEMVFFDRSWYNRAGVERVTGFCEPNEYMLFMCQAPELERMLVASGIHLFKFWFSVSREEQLRRFISRRDDALKHWKLFPRGHPVARPLGRLHRSQKRDVLPHPHRRRALGHHPFGRQKTRPFELYPLLPAPVGLPG